MTTTTTDLHRALLRPPILHILRATGFHSARPLAVEALCDLAYRYLLILATQTSLHSELNHNDVVPSITDVRMALQDVRALAPERTAVEEQQMGGEEQYEDLRGVEAFLAWVSGDVNKEIRRIAGLAGTDAEMAEAGLEVQGDVEKEDFLTGKSGVVDRKK
jgi:transcription initiation factor TFIID subunit 3